MESPFDSHTKPIILLYSLNTEHSLPLVIEIVDCSIIFCVHFSDKSAHCCWMIDHLVLDNETGNRNSTSFHYNYSLPIQINFHFFKIEWMLAPSKHNVLCIPFLHSNGSVVTKITSPSSSPSYGIAITKNIPNTKQTTAQCTLFFILSLDHKSKNRMSGKSIKNYHFYFGSDAAIAASIHIKPIKWK